MSSKRGYRGVGLVARDPRRRRFLLQQKDERYRRYPLGYSFFGGGIEDGEAALEALERELDEELPAAACAALRAAPWTVAWSGRIPGPTGGFDYTLYDVCLSEPVLETIAAGEVFEGLRAALVRAEDLSSLPFVWGLDAVLPVLVSTEEKP